MNFGLIVLSWVLWFIAAGFNPEVPKPNNFWMAVASFIAIANEPSLKAINQTSDKSSN